MKMIIMFSVQYWRCLLHNLNVSSNLDNVQIKKIAKETYNDPTLKDLREIIQIWKLYVPNDKPMKLYWNR